MNAGDKPLSGKTALVTGASRGIGKGIAVALAEAGADLVITARTEAAAVETEAAVKKHGHQCHVVALDIAEGRAPIEESADRIWSLTGGVDILFNNAGSVFLKPALETTESDWDHTLSTNLSGLFWCCQSFGKRMLERGQGKIINVSSDIGIRGEAGWAAYSASKGGAVTLSKTLAWEWAPDVTVNIIAPGPFHTDANRPAFDQPEILRSVEERVPVGRVGDPDRDIGALAVMLAGPGSDFMTGAIFRVDGGICRS